MRIMCWADSVLPPASNILFKDAGLKKPGQKVPKTAKKAKNTKQLPDFDKYCQQRTQNIPVKSYSPTSETEADLSNIICHLPRCIIEETGPKSAKNSQKGKKTKTIAIIWQILSTKDTKISQKLLTGLWGWRWSLRWEECVGLVQCPFQPRIFFSKMLNWGGLDSVS